MSIASRSRLTIAACFILSFSSVFTLSGTSISQVSGYPNFCQLAANNDHIFASFKRQPVYRAILEHVDYETGRQYLQIILAEHPEFLKDFDLCRQNDAIGDPIVHDYGEYGVFSPTTLRYIKVAGDLKQRFGDLSQKHIVEIGAGYGGQCKILSDLIGFASYTIIDLPQCNALSRRYLQKQNVKNVFFIDNDKLNSVKTFDLVISNYAFSEIDRDEQKNYLNFVVEQAPCGYMTLNFISHVCNIQSFPMMEIINFLEKDNRLVLIDEERPNTHPDNRILTWYTP